MVNFLRPYQQTTQIVSNPGLARLTADPDEMVLGGLPGLRLWLDPRRCVEHPDNLFIWKDSVNGYEYTSSGSSTVEGAIAFTAVNNRRAISVNGNAYFQPVAENNFKMPTEAFTAIAVIRNTETDLSVVIGPTVDPVAASPLSFGWGIHSTNRQVLLGQSSTGTPSSRAISNDTGYQSVRKVMAVTFSVERGINFFNGAGLNGGLQLASFALDRTPLGPDTGDALKIQLFREGSSAPSRLIGDAGDILILDRDYSAPRYVGLLAEAMGTLKTWYGVA